MTRREKLSRQVGRFVQSGAEYRSSIPDAARARILARHANGKHKTVEYVLAGEVVGRREFFETGEPEFEESVRNGKKHGTTYQWYDPGVLTFAEPFANGVCHGTAKQWADDGTLIGTYTMVRGTGIDLWRCQREDGSVYLSEVLYSRDGVSDGFAWLINEDQRTLCMERHFGLGGYHGIFRVWNSKGRLSRGYPQYYVHHEKVTKRKYVKACETDATLPRYRSEDNEPARSFPPDIAKELNP